MSAETFIKAKHDLVNALQEFKEECEASPDGEDFETEVQEMVDDLE